MIKIVFYLNKSTISGIVRLYTKSGWTVLAIEKDIRSARGVGKLGIKYENSVDKTIKIR